MNSSHASLRWPELSDRHATSLRECVAWVLDRFEVLGLVASGSIVRGNPDPASDFDVYVIHATPKRQRLQRFFNAVPCEIFVNPPSAIRRYFEEEARRARPSSSHMLATGFVVVDRDPVVAELIAEAQAFLVRGPIVSPKALNAIRYAAATHLEDARDLADRDPAASAWQCAKAVEGMLEYAFVSRGGFIPRAKDLFRCALELDTRIGEEATRAMTAQNHRARLNHAESLAACTIGTFGFYEWESEAEDV